MNQKVVTAGVGMVPMHGMADPPDVAQAALSLASDDASLGSPKCLSRGDPLFATKQSLVRR